MLTMFPVSADGAVHYDVEYGNLILGIFMDP